MRKINILILSEEQVPGGAERVALLLLQMLTESDIYNVYQCYMYLPADNLFDQDSRIRSLSISHTNNVFKKLFNYFLKINRLNKLKKNLEIDLTISALWPTDWINILSGKEKKISIILINVINNPQNINMMKFKRFVSYVYNKFSKIVVCNAYLSDEYKSIFGIKDHLFTVIPNPIDCQLIECNIKEPLNQSLSILFDKSTILIAVNRLHVTKNTEALIHIESRLKRIDSRIKLLIVGDGDEERNIKNAVISEGLTFFDINTEYIDLDLDADVYFLGHQHNIHNLISNADIYLFPTASEGFPLSLLESMYCGVPLVVSDCPTGGTFELMQGKGSYNLFDIRSAAERTDSGYLMPIPQIENPETLISWSDIIEHVLNLERSVLDQIYEFNHNRAKQFDVKVIKNDWLNLIETLVPDNVEVK